MIQKDAQISNAVKEAILLRKRDWLTNLVQTAAADMDPIDQNAQSIRSVVDWLIGLFG
jgi:hypothetical protein